MRWKEGIKASLVASLAYMAIEIPYVYYSFVANAPLLIAMIEESLPPGAPYTPEQLYGLALTTMPFAVAAATIVFSIVLGLIYPILEGRLPGLPVVKGLTFALMVWAATSLLPSLTSPNPLGNVNTLSVSLLAGLCYGLVLGPLFDRFSRRASNRVESSGGLEGSRGSPFP